MLLGLTLEACQGAGHSVGHSGAQQRPASTTAVTAGGPLGAIVSACGGSADSQDGVTGKAVVDTRVQAEPSKRLWSGLTPELTGLSRQQHSREN